METRLAILGISDAENNATFAGVNSTVFTSTPPEARVAAVDGIVKAIGDAYILIVAAGALGLVCAALMKSEKLFLQAGGG